MAKSASRPRRAFVKYFRRLAGLCLLAVLAGGAALFYPQHLLTVDSGPVTADVMVVLGGGSNSERAKYAVELYRAGAAPRILCSGLGDAGANENLLKRAGVPASAILVEDQSRTTRENAQLSIPLLRRLGVRRVIIVTSWYHSRRAWLCFRHYAPDLTFYSRPAYAGYPASAWRPQSIRGRSGSEYLKLLEHLFCYGISPV